MEPGELLAKMGIDSAYRIVQVHPSDRPLFSMRIEFKFAICWFAPKHFSANIADACV
jgi:hypothetical protein